MPVINIFNGLIEDIFRERGTMFVTVSYQPGPGNRGRQQMVRMIVTPRTVILNENGRPVPPNTLRVGMTINATVSAAMTRSIPPQTSAYFIRILRPQRQENVTVGVIQEVNRRNRSFLTMSDRDRSTRIQFNTNNETEIRNRNGRPMEFSRLEPGMRVRVRHANFMTASIPPQTTAFEVQEL